MAMTPKDQAKDSAESVAPLAKHFLWADSPKSVHKLILGLSALCVFLFVMDFLWHRHTKVPGEGLYGFYAIAGFISFTLIVLGAKALRVFIARDESFYAPHGVDAEEYPLEGTERLDHAEHTPDNLSTLKDELLGRAGNRSSVQEHEQSQGGAKS